MSWESGPHGTVTIRGRDCVIEIEPRPAYCDRGNFLARIEEIPSCNRLVLFLDGADGWPRYYFDLERAKAECEAWLVKRGQAL